MLWLLLCFGGQNIFFGRFKSFFVDLNKKLGYSAVSCVLGVFVREGELKSFYSAILSPITSTRIVKMTLSEKEKGTIRNVKITKGKMSLVKVNIQ